MTFRVYADGVFNIDAIREIKARIAEITGLSEATFLINMKTGLFTQVATATVTILTWSNPLTGAFNSHTVKIPMTIEVIGGSGRGIEKLYIKDYFPDELMSQFQSALMEIRGELLTDDQASDKFAKILSNAGHGVDNPPLYIDEPFPLDGWVLDRAI